MTNQGNDNKDRDYLLRSLSSFPHLDPLLMIDLAVHGSISQNSLFSDDTDAHLAVCHECASSLEVLRRMLHGSDITAGDMADSTREKTELIQEIADNGADRAMRKIRALRTIKKVRDFLSGLLDEASMVFSFPGEPSVCLNGARNASVSFPASELQRITISGGDFVSYYIAEDALYLVDPDLDDVSYLLLYGDDVILGESMRSNPLLIAFPITLDRSTRYSLQSVLIPEQHIVCFRIMVS